MNGSGLRHVIRRLNGSRMVIAITMCALVASAIFGTGMLLSAHADSASSGPRVAMHGQLVPALRHARVLHATDGSQALHLDIALTPRNQAQLKQLIADQGNRTTKYFHRYLTAKQYEQQFAPTQATVDALTHFLQAQGLTVGHVSANHTLLPVSGSVATIEQALGVQLNDYQLGSRVVYGPANEPTLPSSLAASVTAIVGLDNVAVYHSHAQRPSASAPRVGGGPSGGYTPAELRAAYDMNPLIASDDGAGQTVAIFELDGFDPTDISTYLSYYSLPTPSTSVSLIDGATNTPGPGAIEVELDMETVSAIAPGAAQHIYIGPNSDKGTLDTYNQIVSDNTASVVSTSWGLCEMDSHISTIQAEDLIFSQAASQGQAIFAAAGDHGAYDCYGDSGSTCETALTTSCLQVDNPADDPNVVGVGGTKMFLNGSDNGYGSESVWDWYDEPPVGTYVVGGGGGYSTIFSHPLFQFGPGVNQNGMRQVPDVSADADPDTGYSVYCTAGSSCNGAGWIVVGGTSAGAPLWAGAAADINQYLAAQSGFPSLGNAIGLLYTFFNTPQPHSAYHDITVGKNIYYPATSGYDMASGIGTPDVWNIAQDAEAYQPYIGYDPSITSVAPDGGMSPPATSEFLFNAGFAPVSWSITSAPAWVTLSPTSGTLSSGGFVNITATFDLTKCVPISGPNSEQTCSGNVAFSAPKAADATFNVPVTAVSAHVSKTWYFAEGYTGPGATEYLTIANPAESGGPTANVTVTYLLGPKNGQPQSPIVKQYQVPAAGRFTVVVNNDVGPNQNVSMVLTSDQPIVAERPYYVVYRGSFGSVPGSSDVLGATSLATSFDFGYVDTSTNHDTWLTILNNNSSAMTATIQYFPAAGNLAPITIQHTVAANSRGTVYVNGESGLAHGVYSALVSLSEPGLVERPLYMLHDSVTGYPGSADVVGVAQPQENWYFAEGYTSNLVNERYILANPTTASGTVSATVTFYRPDGSSVAVPVSLTPGQQQQVSANTALGNGDVDNSAVVTASAPILAERLMSFTYFGFAGVNHTISVKGATEVLGTSSPASLAYFAEGYTGGYVAEYLTIENPSQTTDAIVQINLLPQNGIGGGAISVLVPKHSRYTLYLNPIMVNQWFAMALVSNVPVVAERPMYFNYNGAIPGGTDIIGYQP